MTRLLRAPSVADYDRMTQAARLSAARLVEEQIRLIEERRAALRATRTATAENVHTLIRGAAQLILDDLPHDPPDVTLARQLVLEDAVAHRPERSAAA